MIPSQSINKIRDPRIRGFPIREITNIGGQIRSVSVREIDIPDHNWLMDTPQSIPISVPVTQELGTPIVNVPGCVEVHKENEKSKSKNKNLVNDDPKGNITLCDSGMPSYAPIDYQANELTWTTVTPKQPEADGVKDESAPPAPPVPSTPSPPVIPPTAVQKKECPGPKDLRVGDYSTSGDEKVIGHRWNEDKTICIVEWGPVGITEKYLPAPQTVTTTATIAVVATTSALLAKPLADLLLRIVKPVVKKTVGKVKKILGKGDPAQSLQERRLAQRDRNRALRELRKAMKK